VAALEERLSVEIEEAHELLGQNQCRHLLPAAVVTFMSYAFIV
jgi:hypothetical protein